MTEKEFELKFWLNRAFYANKKAEALTTLVERYRERARGLTANWEGNDTGKSSGSQNGTENALANLLDHEERLLKQINELMKINDEITKAISLLESDDLESVMIHRYLLFHTIEQTAEALNYSVPTVKRKQIAAIKKLIPFELV